MKNAGFCMLVPLFTTALSNTFFYSNACVIVYMLLTGIMIRYNEEEQTAPEPDTGSRYIKSTKILIRRIKKDKTTESEDDAK